MQNNRQIYKPLTHMQLYGEDAVAERENLTENVCPYEGVICPAWDSREGYLAKSCVQRITEAQVGMAIFIEGE